MGCSAACGNRITMSLFGRGKDTATDDKAKLERKLYIARESPEPVFDLSDCQLKQVPSGIFAICKVFRKDELLLNNNCLKFLEEGGLLSDLQLLKILNISFNNFTKVANDIKYLTNLTELLLNDNEIIYLPDGLGSLQNLRILDASNNKLQSLTSSLGSLKCLQQLKLKGNSSLVKLCPELCGASNIISIEIDAAQYICPPAEVAAAGTKSIMMHLCGIMDIEYVPPATMDSYSPIRSSPTLKSPFTKQPSFSWEEQEAAMILQENKMHAASKQQREEFLSKILKEQSQLDVEIAKVQVEKDVDRQRLIQEIQQEERDIASIVNSFIDSSSLQPEAMQQQLEHEQAEHDRLLEICRDNYHTIRKGDILNAMESLFEEECAVQMSLKNYDDYLGDVKKSMLLQELESSTSLEKIFQVKDEHHSALVMQLLEDQNVQKAVVASLLERVDARSWSLSQEVALITANLAKLSIIEQEKQKLQVRYNYNQLLEQRLKLLTVLDDLLHQQNKRRLQLIETVKEMEVEADKSTDFWLKNYKKLIDSAPTSLLEMGKNLDPHFANCLLQEGVIHCLPFLVKFIFSKSSLTEITLDNLKESGISLSSDREGIIKAIESFVLFKRTAQSCSDAETPQALPTAPSLAAINNIAFSGVLENSSDAALSTTECVICMDAKCEIVFVPCGHLCCCLLCAEKEVQICPMCRNHIDKKIRVIIP